MYNIQHAVVVPENVKENIDRDLYQSWMLYYQRGHYVKQSVEQHPFVWAESVDKILEIVADKNTEYLIITWFGLYNHDFWNIHTLCIKDISDKKQDWNVLNNSNECTIQIINLKNWRTEGKPPFSDYCKKKTLAINPTIVNSLLDSKATENPQAWNEELNHFTKLPIINTNLTGLLVKLLTTRNPRHANDRDKGVFFLYNTEAICTNKEHLRTVQAGINTIMGPCSMFKAFILGSKYIDTVDNYLHFDIFQRNLNWKKLITENWDGTKKGLVKTLSMCNDSGDGDFDFWNNSADNIIEKQWKVLLDEFGTKDAVHDAWQIYKTKNHAYALANMLFDDRNIIKELQKFDIKGIYHAIGDIPGFRSNALQFGLEQINTLTKTHINRVADINNNLYVDVKVPASDLQKFKKYDEILLDLEKDYDLFNFQEYSE